MQISLSGNFFLLQGGFKLSSMDSLLDSEQSVPIFGDLPTEGRDLCFVRDLIK